MDTQGSKRDPISSEKAWLDFAVRYLSREAVCKGKGQEAVWSSKCKPSWWDFTVQLPWKNPTANPKDTKEELMKKYDALNKHLREEGRFPIELEEESTLWAEGKYKELFLLTALTSFKGKVTGLHAAVMEACSQAEEMNAKVNQTLIKDIQSCLGATLKAVENLSSKSRQKNMKQPASAVGKENAENGSIKRCRLRADLNEKGQHPVPVSKAVSILPKQTVQDALESHTNSSASNSLSNSSKDIVSQLQKVLKKRKELSDAKQLSVQKNNIAVAPKKHCRSKSSVSNSIRPCSQIGSTQSVALDFHPTVPKSSSPIPIFLSGIISEKPLKNTYSTIPYDNQVNVPLTGISASHDSFVISPENVICSSITLQTVEQEQVKCYGNISQSDEMFLENSVTEDSVAPEKNVNSSEIDFLLSPFNQSFEKHNSCNTFNTIDQDLDDNVDNNKTCIENSPFSDEISSPDRASRTQNGRVVSDSNSHVSEFSESYFSDSGCLSESSFVDSILSPEEQNQLLLDDDLEGFWSNLNESSNTCPVDFSVADLENFVKDI